MNLYELTNEFEELQYKLLSDDENEAEEAYEALTLTNEKIEALLPWYAKLTKNMAAEAEMYKAEADRLTKKARSRTAACERIKSLIRDAMIVTGRDKVKTDIGTYRLQQNPASCIVTDPKKIPVKYLIPQEPTVDRKAILADFKATGEVIDGVDIKREMGLRFS